MKNILFVTMCFALSACQPQNKAAPKLVDVTQYHRNTNSLEQADANIAKVRVRDLRFNSRGMPIYDPEDYATPNFVNQPQMGSEYQSQQLAAYVSGGATTRPAITIDNVVEQPTTPPATSTFDMAKAYGGHYKVGDPYIIRGRSYVPEHDENYDVVGKASWYGKGFDKKKTANGEVFDINSISAAHTTLPLPSIVRVTNLDNNRTMLVRINDRGPFLKDRIIDLSQQAAQLLGVTDTGFANVRVTYDKESTDAMFAAANHRRYNAVRNKFLSDVQNGEVSQDYWKKNSWKLKKLADKISSTRKVDLAASPYARPTYDSTSIDNAKSDKGHFIQVGAFADYDFADTLQQALFRNYANAFAERANINGAELYRVKVGPFDSSTKAKKILKQIKKYGYEEAIITSN